MQSTNTFRVVSASRWRSVLSELRMLWLKNKAMLISSGLFFGSTTLVNLGNYVCNLLLGRWLGPALFADFSLIVTLLLIMTFATTAISMLTAQFVALYSTQKDPSRVAGLLRWLSEKALTVGLVLALLLIVGAPFLRDIFHMHSPWPFVELGVGMPIFFLLAVDRGNLQGTTRFGRFALSNQVEMWVRLLGAATLVALGGMVYGAVAALSLSFLAAWLVARQKRKAVQVQPLQRIEREEILRSASPILLGLIGQIVINNSDVLIVKSYFPAAVAGQYAALAQIGRMVFFATWAVVMMLFPIVIRRKQNGEEHRSLLWLGLGNVALVSGGIVLVTLLKPYLIVSLLFGSAYLSIAPLLWWYALATAFYALANVVATYGLSVGRSNGNYLVMLAGIAQVALLLAWHSTLLLVVLIQVGIMACLLIVLFLWESKGKAI